MSIRRSIASHLRPLGSVQTLRRYPSWLGQRRRYQRMLENGQRLRWRQDRPQLSDRTPALPFDPHYVYQQGWAMRAIIERAPAHHVDVGSELGYVVDLSATVPVTYVELRPVEIALSGFNCVAGTALALPFENRSIESLSCLHTAEHIGLGRYGDPLDPRGTEKAAAELQRVLAPEGQLLFSVPIGIARTEFNAHRILDPRTVAELFAELKLVDFAAVGDAGDYHSHANPAGLATAGYACGLYRFTRAR